MRIKKSQFINRVEIDDKVFYYNSLTNAIIEIDNEQSEAKMLKDIASLENDNVTSDNQYLKLGFIINKNVKEDHIIEYYYQRSKYDTSFLGLELFPSYLCNLKCDFCTLKKLWISNGNLDVSEIENYFKNIREFINSQPINKIVVNVFGGEPLIFYKQILKFIKGISSEKSIFLTIITNGMLLTENIAKEIINHHQIIQFQFTIDGLPDYHNKTKGSDKSFGNTINGINYLIKLKFKGNIVIRINISEKNRDSISELMYLLNSIVYKYDKLSYYPAFINNVNDVVDENYCIENKNSQTILADFYKVCKYLNINYQLFITPLLKNCSYIRENAFVVAPDLKLYKCNDEQTNPQNSVGEISNGKLKLYNFANEGRIKQFNIISQSYLTDVKCKRCSWLPVCRMGCPLGEKPNYCKELMNSKLENYIKFRYLSY